MKSLRYLIAIGVTLGTVAIGLFWANNQDAVSAALAPQTVTPAPTRTPGPPVGITPKAYAVLAEPLTEEATLKRALDIDSRVAIWRGNPWSLDTIRSEPGRVTARWYSDRSYDGTSWGPGAEAGPVWVVTIKGDVRLLLPGRALGLDLVVHDSVTYTIAQKTGDLLRVQAGLPTSNQPFLPKTATPYYQAAATGTAEAMNASSCTANPSGLAIHVTQQPGKSNIPGAGGPVYSFLVEGTGFVPGETVTLIIKARVTVPGSKGTTNEVVGKDSTFATSIGAAMRQPNTPVDLFVIHRRGVACVTVTAVQ